PGEQHRDDDKDDGNREVHGVQTGHGEVGEHEQLDFSRPGAGVLPVDTRNHAIVEVRNVLGRLDPHEQHAQQGGNGEQDDDAPPVVGARRSDRERHYETAQKQNDRVDAAQSQVEMSAPFSKAERIQDPVDGV